MDNEKIIKWISRVCVACVRVDGVEVRCEGCEKEYVSIFFPKSFGEMKKTHSWVAGGKVDRGVYRPFTSHCRACGVVYILWKGAPMECVAKK